MQVPLFPLQTVVFPGGPLPLRIFEARYVDMISRCMKSDSPFGVLLIRDGNETGESETYEVGTLARIVDWYQGSDGLLGITAIGEQRFRLLQQTRQKDGLNLGEIELIPNIDPIPVPDAYDTLPTILNGVLDDLGRLYEGLERRSDDAVWVASRFLEILPMPLHSRQQLLESNGTLRHLELVNELLKAARQ